MSVKTYLVSRDDVQTTISTSDLPPSSSAVKTELDGKVSVFQGVSESGKYLKVDASGNVITATGGSGGTTNYDELSNRPQINSHTLTGNLDSNQLGLLGLSEAQAMSNKVIDADSNTISNIAGGNFKTQATTEAGKVWGIGSDGKTILMPQDGYKYTHYVNMDCTDIDDNVYRITFTAVAAIDTAFTESSLIDYMNESGLVGETAGGYFLPVYGVEYDSGNVSMVLGISAPTKLTMNALVIREGSKSVETNLLISSIADRYVAF